MKIELIQQGSASPEDLLILENRIGARLIPDYVTFALQNDGAQPEANIFKVGTGNQSNIHSFLAVKEIPAAMRHIENLPPQTFPIARDDCGNYILLGTAGAGAVLFWDHEQPEALVKIAESFTAFLELLEPFDGSSVQLLPDQVKSAWIDPEFLKRLQG